MGISRMTIITERLQLGPNEVGSGSAQYSPEAAIMATKAGQRGSRTFF